METLELYGIQNSLLTLVIEDNNVINHTIECLSELLTNSQVLLKEILEFIVNQEFKFKSWWTIRLITSLTTVREIQEFEDVFMQQLEKVDTAYSIRPDSLENLKGTNPALVKKMFETSISNINISFWPESIVQYGDLLDDELLSNVLIAHFKKEGHYDISGKAWSYIINRSEKFLVRYVKERYSKEGLGNEEIRKLFEVFGKVPNDVIYESWNWIVKTENYYYPYSNYFKDFMENIEDTYINAAVEVILGYVILHPHDILKVSQMVNLSFELDENLCYKIMELLIEHKVEENVITEIDWGKGSAIRGRNDELDQDEINHFSKLAKISLDNSLHECYDYFLEKEKWANLYREDRLKKKYLPKNVSIL